MIMVKPTGAYLDIIAKVRESTTLPVGAYQVRGEYLMIESAAAGWVDGKAIALERLTGIKRGDPHLLRQARGGVVEVARRCKFCCEAGRHAGSASKLGVSWAAHTLNLQSRATTGTPRPTAWTRAMHRDSTASRRS
jgi:hypothetical protein